MATELDTVLKRLKITFKSREQAGTPSRGFPPGSTLWRVTLEREVKGAEKPMRFVFGLLSPTEPTTEQVVKVLLGDVEAGELSPWDFAQAFNGGKVDEPAERAHKVCKRVGPRVKRFFGDGWPKVAAVIPKAA